MNIRLTSILLLTTAVAGARPRLQEPVTLAWKFDGVSALRLEFRNRMEIRLVEAAPSEPKASEIEQSGWFLVEIKASGQGWKLRQSPQFIRIRGRGALEGEAVYRDGRWTDNLRPFSSAYRNVFEAAKAAVESTIEIADPSGKTLRRERGFPTPYLWLHLLPQAVSVGDRWRYQNGPFTGEFQLAEICETLGRRCAAIRSELRSQVTDPREGRTYGETQTGTVWFSIDRGYAVRAEVESETHAGMTRSEIPFKVTRSRTELLFSEGGAPIPPEKSLDGGAPVTSLAASSDGRYLASTQLSIQGDAWRSFVKVWDASDGRLLHTSEEAGESVGSATFADGGRRLILASARGKTHRIRSIEAGAWKETASQPMPADTPAEGLADLADGTVAAAVGDTVRRFAAGTLEEVKSVSTGGRIGDVAAGPTAGTALAALEDRILLVDFEKGETRELWKGTADRVFILNGRAFIAGTTGVVAVLDAADAAPRRAFSPSRTLAAASLREPGLLALSTEGGTVRAWDEKSGRELIFSWGPEEYSALTWIPGKAQTLAAGTSTGQIVLWRIP